MKSMKGRRDSEGTDWVKDLNEGLLIRDQKIKFERKRERERVLCL